jgi:hypothetical protein
MNRIYLILALVLAVILSFYLAFSFGKTEERKEWEEKYAKASAEIQVLEAKAAIINEVVVTKYVDKIRYVEKVKIKTVKEFVTAEADNSCIINNGFVSLHNAAAGATVVAVSETDKDPSSIKLSNVAEVVVDNYAEYNKTKAQLESLQGWIRDQQTLWNTTK